MAYISHVKYCGFRSLQNIEVNLVNYNTLIGKNDSGKSSFLLALQKLFDPDFPLTPDDLCKIVGHGNECCIEATIEDCTHALARNGKLEIRRSLERGLEYKCDVPTNDLVRQMFEGNFLRQNLNAFPDLIRDFLNRTLPNVSAAGRLTPDQSKELFQLTHEAGLVEYGEGWRLLDPQVLGTLVQVVMLSASVRGEEELQDTRASVLTKVGGRLLREATELDPGIRQALEELTPQIERVSQKGADGNWVIAGLNRFEEILKEEIHRFDDGVTSESHILAPRPPSVDFSIGVEIRDGCVSGLDHMGHGLRRSIVFAMLRTYKRLKQENVPVAGEPPPPLYLFLVEEPELYLHPQAERRRMAELKELSQDGNAQVVLCTHSAIFVDLNAYKGIHRFERPGRQASRVISWSGPDAGADVAETLSLIWRTNVYRAAMVFADLVILVEGVSEQAAVPHVAKGMELTRPELEVEVVSCDGNSNIPPIQTILEGLGLKYVAWLDNETSEDRGEIEKAKTNRKAFGKIITTELNWEKMNKLTAGSENKIYKSWKYFIKENGEPNDKLQERMVRRLRLGGPWNLMYLSANRIIDIVCEAITERHILTVRYQHTDNQMIVQHRLAPFDVGTTNPKNIQRFADNLYAYSYTHIDRETNLPDPRVITFNIHYFIEIITTEEIFDETDLCLRNLRATKYDYRNCRFALLPNRNWFVTI